MKKALIILIFIPTLIFAQNDRTIDSLKTLLQANTGDTNEVNAINALCSRLRASDGLIEAIEYAERGIALSEKLGFKKGEANCYMQLGSANSMIANYPDAIKCYMKALRIREKLGDDKLTAYTYMGIGNIHYYQKNYDEAIKNYSISLSLQKKIDNKLGIAMSHNCMCSVYSDLNENDKAIYNCSMALKLYEEIGNKTEAFRLHTGIAEILIKQGKYEEAMQHLSISNAMMNESGDYRGLGVHYFVLGTLYEKQGKYIDARRAFGKSIALSRKTTDRNISKMSYEAMSKSDSALSDYKSAYNNYKIFSAYKDSLFNEDATRKTTQAQMQYEFDKKEDAIKAEQDKKDAITTQEKKRQRIIIYSVASGLLLVIMFAGFIFRSLKITRKQKGIIELQKVAVEKQKKIVDERNKEITDSIKYASRIQQAILPPDEVVKNTLPEHALIFEPKDIVSGDFYFVDKKGDKIFWATCDATGHGASGAMLSMLGTNILSSIISDGETIPSKILDKLNKYINESLHKTGDDSIRDGMDVTLCSLDTQSLILNYAGANNPLWIIRNGELIEYKADKMPIGQMYKDASYINHEIQLQTGDTIYSFSDGVCDQFNKDGKKFMKKRVRELLLSIQSQSMQEQKEAISQTIMEWKRDCEQTDDMLLIGVRV